jgi:hypothetical protein
MDDLPANALDDAKSNLHRFAMVGLQERFEESLALLQRTLGLSPIAYISRHMTIDRPSASEIGRDERALISEHNRLDIELYAFARKLFGEAVAGADPGLEDDAAMLRSLNESATGEAMEVAEQWLDRELPVGATRPKAELFAAAAEGNVSPIALKHVSKFGVQKERRDGEMIWTRVAQDRPPRTETSDNRRKVVTLSDGRSTSIGA